MSILGTLGPLVRGSRRRALQVVPILPSAFIVGSVFAFFVTWAIGAASGLHSLPLTLRFGIAGFGSVMLTGVDIVGVRRSSYCPLGMRRQTPRTLIRRFPLGVATTLWGFDLGLGVTTYRVTALIWAGMLLVLLGLCPWSIGVAYGAAFALPLSLLLFVHTSGATAHAASPRDPGLERMLSRRSAVQAVSAVALGTGAAVMLSQIPLAG